MSTNVEIVFREDASKTIKYTFQRKEGLKSHYISVDGISGVILQGPEVSKAKADGLILKKAKWIIDKLKLVESSGIEDIVTGSRIPYFGKTYYVQVIINKTVQGITIDFNHSSFKITVPDKNVPQYEINDYLQKFYKEKALAKIVPELKCGLPKLKCLIKIFTFVQ